MNEITSKDLKRLQLDILVVIDKFCRINNIKYSLVFGTLLGAVRHKGFIPWDDDIDIAMPRPHYEKFIKLFPGYHHDYELVCSSTCKLCSNPYAKVSDIRTLAKKELYENDGLGVNIDVFPIDGVKNIYQISKIQRWLKYLNTKKARLSRNRSFFSNVVVFWGKILLLPITLRKLIEKIENMCTKYNYEECLTAAICCDADSYREFVPREIFDDLIELNFEGKQFFCPRRYDEYLTNTYGEYMQAPPEKKRISTHHVKYYWK